MKKITVDDVMNKMKIGFHIKWKKGSLSSKTNVLGDELLADSMCRALLKNRNIESCELYAPNYSPDQKLDVMIYLNDTKPNKNWAIKHVLCLQNAYGAGSDTVLRKLQPKGYDGYAFISERLLQIHRADGHHGIFLPFGWIQKLLKKRWSRRSGMHKVLASFVGGYSMFVRCIVCGLRWFWLFWAVVYGILILKSDRKICLRFSVFHSLYTIPQFVSGGFCYEI